MRRTLAGGGFGFRSSVALALVRPLAWDSAHFGVSCADLVRVYAAPSAPAEELGALLEQTVTEARRRGIELLSARLLAAQTVALHWLLRRGFLLVDTSVELGGRLPLPRPQAPTGAHFRDAGPEDEGPLAAIAAEFVANRFHRDPRIPGEQAVGVYQRWAGAAARGEHGRAVAAELGGRLAGFATYHLADEELSVGVMGLVAVEARSRGHRLVDGLVHACAERAGGRAMVTSTQVGNVAAQRAFARSGLLPIGARHVLHGWLT